MYFIFVIICIHWRSFPYNYFIIIQESIYNALSLIYASIYVFDEKWKCELKHFQHRFMKPPFLLMESLIYIRFTFIILQTSFPQSLSLAYSVLYFVLSVTVILQHYNSFILVPDIIINNWPRSISICSLSLWMNKYQYFFKE